MSQQQASPAKPASPPKPKAPPSASLDEIIDACRWGDLLLFKCRMPHTAVIRAATLTQYDHVAVVSTDRSGQLMMLEACVLGVRAFPLAQRVREYAKHFADVIAWRRLLVQRTEEQAEACCRFVQEVDGLKYSYDPLKILFSLRRADASHADTTEQAYYCSELVCALWQRCGLMQKTCRAASFWPGDLGDGCVCERWLADGVALAPAVVLQTPADERPLPASALPARGLELPFITTTMSLPSLPFLSTPSTPRKPESLERAATVGAMASRAP